MVEESHSPLGQPGTIDEQGSHCFGCGPGNPQGLGLQFEIDGVELVATAVVTLTRMHEGPPGYVHGGIIATLLDEAMSKLNRPLQVLAMTRHLEVDYLRPVPVETGLVVRSHHVRRDGRKLFHAAEIVGPDGRALARGKGVFVVVERVGVRARDSE